MLMKIATQGESPHESQEVCTPGNAQATAEQIRASSMEILQQDKFSITAKLWSGGVSSWRRSGTSDRYILDSTEIA